MKNTFFVTSSIAAGKSSFLKIAENMGFSCLSADEISAQILQKNANKISKLFENENLLKNHKIDKKALAELIFKDKFAKKKLENFMHPLIRAEILEKIQHLEQENKPFFVEIPLFFETKAYENLGKVIVIYSTKELSLERLIKRNNLSKKEAILRLNSQIDIEEKIKKADFVIENLGSFEEFEKKCENFLQNLKGLR